MNFAAQMVVSYANINENNTKLDKFTSFGKA